MRSRPGRMMRRARRRHAGAGPRPKERPAGKDPILASFTPMAVTEMGKPAHGTLALHAASRRQPARPGWRQPRKRPRRGRHRGLFGAVRDGSGMPPQCPSMPCNRPDSKTGRRGTGRRAGSQTGSRNIAAATAVGTKADRNSLPAEILPSGKAFLRMAYPAGLGALAITVRPPPVTAPATNM